MAGQKNKISPIRKELGIAAETKLSCKLEGYDIWDLGICVFPIERQYVCMYVFLTMQNIYSNLVILCSFPLNRLVITTSFKSINNVIKILNFEISKKFLF